MPEYVARNVTVIDLSNPRNIKLPEVYQPESCFLKLQSNNKDVGSLCYSKRKLNRNGGDVKTLNKSHGVYVSSVDQSSLDRRRRPLIRKLIGYSAYCAKTRSPSFQDRTLGMLFRFLDFYFNQSGLDYFKPESRLHFEEAARRYSALLQLEKSLQARQKNDLTRKVFTFAQWLYDDVELNVYDYDIISCAAQNKKGTIPLLPQEHDLALALRTTIFEGVTDLLVHNRPLPHGLNVPAVCGEMNDTIWLGYAPWRGPTPFPRAKDFEKIQPKEWFDRDKGVLVTKSQWLARGDIHNRKLAHSLWQNAQKCLKRVNSDRSNLKISLAEYAGQCFLDLILSITGMNQQPALDLPWHGGYFAQKAKQGSKTITLVKPEDQSELEQAEDPSIYLRSIKHRKAYQPVEVTINNRFLPQFRRYLQLRDYYLNGRPDARLFPFSANLINDRRSSLHAKFPEFPNMGARKARASVSDSILESADDPYVVAQVLQNSPETVIKHYAAGTQKAHIKGVGGFFNALSSQIKVARLKVKNEVETAAGSCDNGGSNPESLPGAPIEADCIQQEGCFFCKHYCVHADEIDIRKLISVLYYINKGATRAYDVNLFNELFELVITRIKDLLEQIEAISEEKKTLVARIKGEVFVEEMLDGYWLRKLNRLEMLLGEY